MAVMLWLNVTFIIIIIVYVVDEAYIVLCMFCAVQLSMLQV
jgi:hypothetical protein